MTAPIFAFANNPRKIGVTKEGIARFNSTWPCSELRATRSYWFEYDSRGDLIDTDCPQSDDGSAAVAMVEDCRAYLMDGATPSWAL